MLWIVLGILVFLLLSIALKFRTKIDINKKYPYRKSGPLFTPAERSFFGVLKNIVGSEIEIFGKVRVADVINPEKGLSRSVWQVAFNKISRKHFDFLLCRSDDLSVLCAIELNDSSHKSQKRTDRDTFLEAVCSEANLPLIQIPAKAAYHIEEISKVIAPFIKPDSNVPAQNVDSTDPIATEKLCPKCKSQMVIKVASKGQYAGKKFWGCSAFPECRYLESYQESN